MIDKKDRWRGAVHEAGHAVAALALGGRCKSLSLHPEGRGIACLDGLSPFDLAIATAAAGHAEELLGDEHEPAPAQEPVNAQHETRDCDFTPTVDLATLAARYPLKTAVSDEQTVARFCIAGLECEPERWAARYNVIHAVTRRVVSDHHKQILAVARALFTRNILSESEIRKEYEKA